MTKPLRFRNVSCKHCVFTDAKVPYQKGVDVALVTDMIGLAFEDAYNIAIILSGDNDFVNAVNYVKSKGKNVWVTSFRRALGEDLMRSADKVIKLAAVSETIALEERNV